MHMMALIMLLSGFDKCVRKEELEGEEMEKANQSEEVEEEENQGEKEVFGV